MKYNKSSLIVILIIIIFTFSYINSKKYIIEGNKDEENSEKINENNKQNTKNIVSAI